MIVVSKRNILLPGPNGERFHMPRDYMGPVPDWAEKSAYLLALAEDRKVILSEEKSRRGKKPPEKLEEPPADPPAGESGETE